jgi:hypothetical protein
MGPGSTSGRVKTTARFFFLCLVDAKVRFAPILLQKSFEGDERNFLGPLMLFVR